MGNYQFRRQMPSSGHTKISKKTRKIVVSPRQLPLVIFFALYPRPSFVLFISFFAKKKKALFDRDFHRAVRSNVFGGNRPHRKKPVSVRCKSFSYFYQFTIDGQNPYVFPSVSKVDLARPLSRRPCPVLIRISRYSHFYRMVLLVVCSVLKLSSGCQVVPPRVRAVILITGFFFFNLGRTCAECEIMHFTAFLSSSIGTTVP